MRKKKKDKYELRYYEIPQKEPVLALLGEKWIRCYGHDVDFLHFHNLYEIGYCYWGNGEFVLDGTVHRFKANMVSFIPKNYPHTTNSDAGTFGKWEYLFFDVEAFLHAIYESNVQFAEELMQKINTSAYFVEALENKRVAWLTQEIMEEMRNKQELYCETIKGLLVTLLLEIARMNKGKSTEMKSLATGEIQIGNALDYVSNYYYKTIPIEKLAEVCHMSETHFRRLFEARMHMTPVEYVNLIRVQTACRLMKKTRASMTDIAEKVGFQTIST